MISRFSSGSLWSVVCSKRWFMVIILGTTQNSIFTSNLLLILSDPKYLFLFVSSVNIMFDLYVVNDFLINRIIYEINPSLITCAC